MEEYEIFNQESFELKDIFDCGQCFRWNQTSSNEYTGVIKDAVIKVRKEDNKVIFYGKTKNNNLKEIVESYFDLSRNYDSLKNDLSKIDDYMKESILFGSGIRILRQDIWETLISFIISANNNIPRIKKIIEAISKAYGEKIVFENKEYFLFPTPKSLSKASVEDLRALGLGFRDKRVYEVTRKVNEGEVNLEELLKIDSTDILREELLKLDGVGPKVADCILLFGCNRFDVFPIDVWVRRVMNELYIHNENEEKVDKKEISHLAKEKFGKVRGLAQQYLFYWKREN